MVWIIWIYERAFWNFNLGRGGFHRYGVFRDEERGFYEMGGSCAFTLKVERGRTLLGRNGCLLYDMVDRAAFDVCCAVWR